MLVGSFVLFVCPSSSSAALCSSSRYWSISSAALAKKLASELGRPSILTYEVPANYLMGNFATERGVSLPSILAIPEEQIPVPPT